MGSSMTTAEESSAEDSMEMATPTKKVIQELKVAISKLASPKTAASGCDQVCQILPQCLKDVDAQEAALNLVEQALLKYGVELKNPRGSKSNSAAAKLLEMVFPLMWVDKQPVREVALRVVKMIPTDPRPECWNKLKTAMHTGYCKALLSMVVTMQRDWPTLWMETVKFFGTDLHSGANLINQLLGVLERAYKNPDIKWTRIQAFECWKVLIDSFKSTSLNPKRVALILIPLRATNHRTEELTKAKYETFLHLIKSLPKTQDVHDTLKAFLTFCFYASGDTLLPLRSYASLQPFCFEALEIAVARACESKCVATLTKQIVLAFHQCLQLPNIDEERVKKSWIMLLENISEAKGTDAYRTLIREILLVLDDLVTLSAGANGSPSVSPSSSSSMSSMSMNMSQNSSPPQEKLGVVLADLLYELIVGPSALTASQLASVSLYVGNDGMTGTPALMAVNWLLTPGILLSIGCTEKYKTMMNHLINASIECLGGPLSFIPKVLKMSAKVISQSDSTSITESLTSTWCSMAEVMVRWVNAGGGLNQGDAASHDFSCLYAVVQFPVTHLCAHVSSWIKVWGQLYQKSAPQVALVSTTGSHEFCNQISSRLTAVIKSESRDRDAQLSAAVACGEAMVRAHKATNSKWGREQDNVVTLLSEVAPIAAGSKSEELMSAIARCVAQLENPVPPCSASLQVVENLAPVVLLLLRYPSPGQHLAQQIVSAFVAVKVIVEKHWQFPSHIPKEVQIAVNSLVTLAKTHPVQNIRNTGNSLSMSTSGVAPDESSSSDMPAVVVGSILHPRKDIVGSKTGEIKTVTPKTKTAFSPVEKFPVDSPTNRKKRKIGDAMGQFVVINRPTPVKMILTEHQKEVMRQRKSDIPALYQDLSQDTQSASQDCVILPSSPANPPKKARMDPEEEAVMDFEDVIPFKNVSKNLDTSVSILEEEKSKKMFGTIEIDDNATMQSVSDANDDVLISSQESVMAVRMEDEPVSASPCKEKPTPVTPNRRKSIAPVKKEPTVTRSRNMSNLLVTRSGKLVKQRQSLGNFDFKSPPKVKRHRKSLPSSNNAAPRSQSESSEDSPAPLGSRSPEKVSKGRVSKAVPKVKGNEPAKAAPKVMESEPSKAAPKVMEIEPSKAAPKVMEIEPSKPAPKVMESEPSKAAEVKETVNASMEVTEEHLDTEALKAGEISKSSDETLSAASPSTESSERSSSVSSSSDNTSATPETEKSEPGLGTPPPVRERPKRKTTPTRKALLLLQKHDNVDRVSQAVVGKSSKVSKAAKAESKSGGRTLRKNRSKNSFDENDTKQTESEFQSDKSESKEETSKTPGTPLKSDVEPFVVIEKMSSIPERTAEPEPVEIPESDTEMLTEPEELPVSETPAPEPELLVSETPAPEPELLVSETPAPEPELLVSETPAPEPELPVSEPETPSVPEPEKEIACEPVEPPPPVTTEMPDSDMIIPESQDIIESSQAPEESLTGITTPRYTENPQKEETPASAKWTLRLSDTFIVADADKNASPPPDTPKAIPAEERNSEKVPRRIVGDDDRSGSMPSWMHAKKIVSPGKPARPVMKRISPADLVKVSQAPNEDVASVSPPPKPSEPTPTSSPVQSKWTKPEQVTPTGRSPGSFPMRTGRAAHLLGLGQAAAARSGEEIRTTLSPSCKEEAAAATTSTPTPVAETTTASTPSVLNPTNGPALRVSLKGNAIASPRVKRRTRLGLSSRFSDGGQSTKAPLSPGSEWVRRTYQPDATPETGILKKPRHSAMWLESDGSPSSRKKRVSFHDPPVSKSLNFYITSEDECRGTVHMSGAIGEPSSDKPLALEEKKMEPRSIKWFKSSEDESSVTVIVEETEQEMEREGRLNLEESSILRQRNYDEKGEHTRLVASKEDRTKRWDDGENQKSDVDNENRWRNGRDLKIRKDDDRVGKDDVSRWKKMDEVDDDINMMKEAEEERLRWEEEERLRKAEELKEEEERLKMEEEEKARKEEEEKVLREKERLRKEEEERIRMEEERVRREEEERARKEEEERVRRGEEERARKEEERIREETIRRYEKELKRIEEETIREKEEWKIHKDEERRKRKEEARVRKEEEERKRKEEERIRKEEEEERIRKEEEEERIRKEVEERIRKEEERIRKEVEEKIRKEEEERIRKEVEEERIRKEEEDERILKEMEEKIRKEEEEERIRKDEEMKRKEEVERIRKQEEERIREEEEERIRNEEEERIRKEEARIRKEEEEERLRKEEEERLRKEEEERIRIEEERIRKEEEERIRKEKERLKEAERFKRENAYLGEEKRKTEEEDASLVQVANEQERLGLKRKESSQDTNDESSTGSRPLKKSTTHLRCNLCADSEDSSSSSVMDVDDIIVIPEQASQESTKEPSKKSRGRPRKRDDGEVRRKREEERKRKADELERSDAEWSRKEEIRLGALLETGTPSPASKEVGSSAKIMRGPHVDSDLSQIAALSQGDTSLTHPILFPKPGAVYPSLMNCEEPIGKIVDSLTGTAWRRNLIRKFGDNNLTTVGHLASLTEEQVNRYAIRPPRKETLVKALEKYERDSGKTVKPLETPNRQAIKPKPCTPGADSEDDLPLASFAGSSEAVPLKPGDPVSEIPTSILLKELTNRIGVYGILEHLYENSKSDVLSAVKTLPDVKLLSDTPFEEMVEECSKRMDSNTPEATACNGKLVDFVTNAVAKDAILKRTATALISKSNGKEILETLFKSVLDHL